VARLRRSDCSAPGITRRRRGKGFQYLDEKGHPVRDPEVRRRIEELAIPPAWDEVWICPYPMGHIQATGVDAAGRKQYRYHDRWRQRQDAAKFDEMLEFARALPLVRDRVAVDLERPDMDRARVLACALRLLDRGFFRIGSESYAEENETYGLATMKKKHATVDGPLVRFDYAAKGKQRRLQSFVDVEVADVVDRLKRRRGGIDELLAYKEGGRWRDVKSQDINDYLKEITGADFSAKDFRTWSATVLAAWFLALAEHTTGATTARKRVQTQVVREVAKHMGNTPTVCRSSYIDPRVFDRHDGGITIEGATDLLVEVDGHWPNIQPVVEEATIHLIEDEPALARVA
jgi:DNA topoisomerase IB